MVTFLVVILLAPMELSAQWAIGAEGNDRYSYVWLTRYQPLHSGSGGDTVVGWLTGSWRRYEPGPAETVSGPGLAAGATYRRSRATWTGSVGAGYEARWLDVENGGVSSDLTETGPVLLGDLSVRVQPRFTVNGNAHYWGADEWMSTSASALYELNSALRAGPEIGYDGNGDVDVRRIGGIVGLARGSGWLYLRGGQATLSDRFGNDTTQPYFSAGIAGAF